MVLSVGWKCSTVPASHHVAPASFALWLCMTGHPVEDCRVKVGRWIGGCGLVGRLRRYTEELKRRQIREYGYADRRLRSYEEDHLIPIGIGGSPDDHRNLWPEPRETADGWNADRKDELEAVLPRLVCARQVSLREAQRAIATDWISAYRRFVTGE